MRQGRRGDDDGGDRRARRRHPDDNGSEGGGRRRPEPLVDDGRRRRRRPVEKPKSRRRSRAARHPLVILLSFGMLFLVLGLVGGLALFVFGERTFLARGPLVEDTGVVVEQGFSMENIAEGLQGRGVISNRYVFIAAAYVLGTTGKMQAGEYMIPAGASMKEVMQRIVAGDVVQHAITLAEGLTSAQIVQRLNENEILVGRINEIPAEGSLLPETYRITRGMSRQRLIDTMQLEQAQLLARVWAGRDPNLPLQSPEELVTLASIVEKETGVDAERARIAGVFINRLKRRMRLQSDPTILYGLYGGDAWSQPRTLYRSDMERENPYNTYQITGLPPGPIANPGREALEAVAHPAETAELYFVADGTGGHVFSQTYEQHQANVARWREVERQRRGPTTE